jgi:molybdopterin synthase catalytic subunit
MFEIVDHPLDPQFTTEAVRSEGVGAIVLFIGTVRDMNEGRKVLGLEYDAYRSMAEKEMRRLGEEITSRWPAARVAMQHRVGKLAIGDVAVIIAVSAPHRQEAFEASRYAIDRMKEIVPVWKKETWKNGEGWLEGQTARPSSDDTA